MAVAHVQSKGAGSNSVAFDAGNTAGNLLVCAIGSAGDVTNVTDTAGNTWAKAVDGDTGGTDIYGDIWYAMNCAAGANTVSLTGGFGGFEAIAVAEYSGVTTSPALDRTAVATDATGADLTPDSGATATTTQADELLVGAIANQEAQSCVWGGSFTERYDGVPASRTVTLADRVVAATGAYGAAGTLAGGSPHWVALIATFKAAAAGAAAGPAVAGNYGAFPKAMLRPVA